VGEETIIGLLPFSHIYAVTLILNFGLLLAARTVLIPRLDMRQIFESIRRYRATISRVPTLYVRLINDERAQRYDMSSIEVCLSGALLPVKSSEALSAPRADTCTKHTDCLKRPLTRAAALKVESSAALAFRCKTPKRESWTRKPVSRCQ
jgi:acyl-CoA synthetase (AMP-forming)/AMP-acid ligase II